MDVLSLCMCNIPININGLSIRTTLEHIVGWSKYTLTGPQNRRSDDVHVHGPNIWSLTGQMDDCLINGPCYSNFDRPNGRQSN